MEILVVLGLIVLLAGILIPVVSKVRSAAYATDSNQRISVISTAIQQYYQEFRAYPGPFRNEQIGDDLEIGTNTLTGPGLTETTKVTQSENLTLALMGGLNIEAPAPPTITAFTYDPDEIGRGPASLNPYNLKRYSSFLDLEASELTGEKGVRNPLQQYPPLLGGEWTAKDSVIPEFVDRFPEPMPILYLRAKVGASGIADVALNTLQYNVDHLHPYMDPYFPTSDFTTGEDYLKHPTLTGVPKQKDGYILISAGKDRKYGTKDDITNFGGF